ncbi:MAG TPA: phosphate acetyltransferase [Mycobacteriales bacterium]|nr:phosphate acetyltransferase [Mycobacteriales bacterium]
MARTVYVAALEADTGKSVVALGVLELLAGRVGRVGFFRPVVGDGPGPDRLVELVRERYQLTADPERLRGVTYAELHELTAAGRTDELVSRVVERFRAVERDCDAVLCVGSDFADVSAPTEFALNLRLADNLGAAVLAVVSGRRKTAAEVVASVRYARDTLAAAGAAVVAVVANRVDPAELAAVRAGLDGGDATAPAYAIPYDPVLVEPTVGEVAAEVGARVVRGDPAELDRDVRGVVVAAATLPTVLDYLADGALVLTPGDRSEVVLGVLAAAMSASAPHVSGLLLTTGLVPDPRVQRILDGLAPHIPVLAVDTDMFTTVQAVGRVQGHLTAGGTRKIAAALGAAERHIDLAELAQRIELTRSRRVTPLMFEYDLVERARADRRHVVLPEGTDDRVLRATETVLRRDVAAVTLLGRPDEIRARAAALGLDLTAAEVLDPTAPGTLELRERFAATYAQARAHRGVTLQQARDVVTDVSYFGTLMVHAGLADGMVSGAQHTTAHTIRPAFEVIRTVPGVRTVSSVFFMCLADRVLVYGDCAIIPEPDAAQLADIAVSSAATARRFGVEPRVAMLSYSTGTSGSGAEVDKVREATRLVREREPALPVEGPIQYDAAVDASVARTKLPDSRVAGQATVFVFPDLNTGNNTYKAVQRSAGAVAVGPVLQGLRRPVNDLSRGCTVADIVNTVAITAIQAQTPPA